RFKFSAPSPGYATSACWLQLLLVERCLIGELVWGVFLFAKFPFLEIAERESDEPDLTAFRFHHKCLRRARSTPGSRSLRLASSPSFRLALYLRSQSEELTRGQLKYEFLHSFRAELRPLP